MRNAFIPPQSSEHSVNQYVTEYQNNHYAPIVIPTLCRSTHFKRLIRSLSQNPWARYTEVFVGLDYPPSVQYQKGWEEIRDYLRDADLSAFKALHVIEREKNYGYFKNTDDLRELVFKGHDRYILLSDDLEVSLNFIEYMDKALDRYAEDERVAVVCGYSYPVKWHTQPEATCLLQNVNAAEWGIGFWKKKDKTIREYIERGGLYEELKDAIHRETPQKMIDPCRREFICGTCLPRFMQRPNSFLRTVCDISLRIYLAVRGKYAVSPVISKVRQHGFDGTGLYCGKIDTSLNGNTAGTYNYPAQPIDTSSSFTLVEDTIHDDRENLIRLNAFDGRTEKEMARTRHLIWILKNIGTGAAKVYGMIMFMIDIPGRAARKIMRKIGRG